MWLGRAGGDRRFPPLPVPVEKPEAQGVNPKTPTSDSKLRGDPDLFISGGEISGRGERGEIGSEAIWCRVHPACSLTHSWDQIRNRFQAGSRSHRGFCFLLFLETLAQ